MNIVGPILRLFSVLVGSTAIGAIPVYHESFQRVTDHVMILFILFVWRECRRKVLQCGALNIRFWFAIIHYKIYYFCFTETFGQLVHRKQFPHSVIRKYYLFW